jgi:hypothetical protein
MMVWSQRKKGSSTKSPFLASSARHHPVNPLPVSLFFSYQALTVFHPSACDNPSC